MLDTVKICFDEPRDPENIHQHLERRFISQITRATTTFGFTGGRAVPSSGK
jgi:hypothetical protein